MAELNERGALLTRTLEDGRVIDVIPLTFGRARIVISPDARLNNITDGW